MSTLEGKPIDFHALVSVLTDRYVFLNWITKSRSFYGASTSYMIAGSFTGYLIGQFGWERYRDFYRRTRNKSIETSFAETYGTSLLIAEHRWRDALLKRRESYEPELTRLLGERRVEAAYNAGHVYRCLEEMETLAAASQANARTLCYGASAHFYLGHYKEAADLLDRAIQAPDNSLRGWRSHAHLQLGNSYDLLGQRDKAVAAYQRALSEPDSWSPWAQSTHELAREYLNRPYSEQDVEKSFAQRLSRRRRGALRWLRARVMSTLKRRR
jgi:tetratricopeptide (TPR) repeat protein